MITFKLYLIYFLFSRTGDGKVEVDSTEVDFSNLNRGVEKIVLLWNFVKH